MKTQTASNHRNDNRSPRQAGAAWHFMGFAALSMLLITTLACINRPVRRAIPDPKVSFTKEAPQNTERDVDILFVVDDSYSMDDEQQRLSDNFKALMTSLKRTRGGLPNVHIGVTSTSVSAGESCTGEGKNGALQKGQCNLDSGNYIVDVEPGGCNIAKTTDPDTGALTQCGTYSCTQSDCPAGTQLVTDDLNCPRCRNYTDTTLENLFGCMAKVGTDGCQFEQPLEAMYKALDDHPDNQGFVRDNAYLTVVLVTDEDDCSAADTALYNSSDATSGGQDLGPRASFRCFEYGIVCDQESREEGTKTNCRVAEGNDSMMHDLGRYKDLLHEIKDESMVLVAAIAGPTGDGTVQVTKDGHKYLVGASCGEGNGNYEGAKPAFRINAFVESMTDPKDMDWASTSICADSYNDALTGIGNKLVDLMDTCAPVAFKGCHAPEADADGNIDTATCMPMCSITDKFNKGASNEETLDVPHCLEVCDDGLCDGNEDPSQAYRGGHPAARDANLPVQACWYTELNQSCSSSAGVELVIARRDAPPPRSFTKIACAGFQTTEQLCNDKIDNDLDGLIDSEDPDCAPQQ